MGLFSPGSAFLDASRLARRNGPITPRIRSLIRHHVADVMRRFREKIDPSEEPTQKWRIENGWLEQLTD